MYAQVFVVESGNAAAKKGTKTMKNVKNKCSELKKGVKPTPRVYG
jgi:hypothetical protein